MDQILFFIVLIMVVVLCLTIMFLVNTMAKLLKTLEQHKQAHPHINAHIEKIDTSEIKHEINRQALNQLDVFSKDISVLQQEYKDSLKKVQKENIDLITNISKSIEKVLLSEADNFKDTFDSEIASILQRAGKRTSDAEDAALSKIEAYKKAKLTEIDNKSFQILSALTKVLLQKTLTKEDHEKLIEQALDKAKSEGMFDV